MIRNNSSRGYIRGLLLEMIDKYPDEESIIQAMITETGKTRETILEWLLKSNLLFAKKTQNNGQALPSTNIRHIRRKDPDELPTCETRTIAEGGVCHGRKKCCRGDGVGGMVTCSVVQ